MGGRQVCLVLGLFLILGVAIRASGDGCETRQATQAERDFQLKVKSAIKTALPPAPSAWEVFSEDKVEAEDRVCVGEERSPIRVFFSKSYREGEDLRERRLRQAMVAFPQAGPTPEQKAKLDDLIQRKTELSLDLAGKIQKAAERKDTQAMQKLIKDNEKEAQPLDRQIEALNAQIQNRRDQKTEGVLPKDAKASIRVSVNYADTSGYGGGKDKQSLVQIPGAAWAVRVENPRRVGDDWREGATHVYLGRWKPAPQNASSLAPTFAESSTAPHTRAQTIVVTVEAERNRAQQLFEKINWQALQALLR